jgi:hypothetical protein
MLTRFHIVAALWLIALVPSYAGKPLTRDGSTREKAIPLTQHGARAVDEEMTWMMKLHHYTPVLAARESLAKAVQEVKAGNKNVKATTGYQHATLKHGSQWCSYWSFQTPRGQKNVYFDTGIPIDTPGEVARQERVRSQYMVREFESFRFH